MTATTETLRASSEIAVETQQLQPWSTPVVTALSIERNTATGSTANAGDGTATKS